MKLENFLTYYDSSMDKNEALDAPKRSFTRSQAKEIQAKVVEISWDNKKMLYWGRTKDLKTCGENLAKFSTCFMVQVQDEEDWIP